jgi:hypothetical protein
MDHKEFAARPHGVGGGATVGSKRRRPDEVEAHGAGAGAAGSKPKRKHDSEHDGPKERPRHLSVDRYLRGGQDGSIAKVGFSVQVPDNGYGGSKTQATPYVAD